MTSAARKDINCVFPEKTLRRAEAAGKIGTIASYAFTFMGEFTPNAKS